MNARDRMLAALVLCGIAMTGCDRQPTPPATGGGLVDSSSAKPAVAATMPATHPAVQPAISATQPIVPPVAPPPAPEAYELREGSSDGIPKWYMGRQIAHVMGHQAADWLERPTREQEENPSKLIEILSKRIKPTDVFADIGAGTGYYSFRLAKLVPQGKVLAVDIQQQMLDLLTQKAAQQNIPNVQTILGAVDDPKLPANSVDYALLVDAYHEFDHPREMMQGIVKGLKPGGKVLLVEFRGEDINVPIKTLHKMTQAQAKREMDAAGLKHVETIADLPWQHVMVFEKPR